MLIKDATGEEWIIEENEIHQGWIIWWHHEFRDGDSFVWWSVAMVEQHHAGDNKFVHWSEDRMSFKFYHHEEVYMSRRDAVEAAKEMAEKKNLLCHNLGG